MLIDILNSSNYISVNRDAIRIFGLNTAVYCSELLTIYKKAITKKKLYDDNYFKVDRSYIEKQISISRASFAKEASMFLRIWNLLQDLTVRSERSRPTALQHVLAFPNTMANIFSPMNPSFSLPKLLRFLSNSTSALLPPLLLQ